MEVLVDLINNICLQKEMIWEEEKIIMKKEKIYGKKEMILGRGNNNYEEG